jgi:hypothetical protein
MVRVAILAVLLAACGGGSTVTRSLRDRLESPESRAARDRAPELIAQVEAALEDAEAAQRANDAAAAADHATRARLLLDAAVTEAARIVDEEERGAVEERVASALARARRDEAAREAIGAELARHASARAAREEALRALVQAAEDEARPRRRARVSLEEAQDLRRAAEALRARARLTVAAAEALGASADAIRPANEALAASEEARTNLIAALDAADHAHHEALRALGEARSQLEAPGPDGASALAEAARAEGFEAIALPEGLAVEAEGIFAAGGIARNARARVERLAALVAAHPHGPVQVQAQVPIGGPRGERLAVQRAEALRRALVGAGADASRLSAYAVPPALAADAPLDRARLLFVGYAPAP